MSTGTLIAHVGGKYRTREELAALPCPTPTETKPARFRVWLQREPFNDHDPFSCDVEAETVADAYLAVFNHYNKSGKAVNTTGVHHRLNNYLDEATVAKLLEAGLPYVGWPASINIRNKIICDIFVNHVLPMKLFERTYNLYFNDDQQRANFPERSLWTLNNTFTEAVKVLSVTPQQQGLIQIGRQFARLVPRLDAPRFTEASWNDGSRRDDSLESSQDVPENVGEVEFLA